MLADECDKIVPVGGKLRLERFDPVGATSNHDAILSHRKLNAANSRQPKNVACGHKTSSTSVASRGVVTSGTSVTVSILSESVLGEEVVVAHGCDGCDGCDGCAEGGGRYRSQTSMNCSREYPFAVCSPSRRIVFGLIP